MSRHGGGRTDTWGSGWWAPARPGRGELLAALAPLLERIRSVDETVGKIALGEGRVADLLELEQLLLEPFSLSGQERRPLTLARPSDVQWALSSLSGELHLEVHMADGKYPSYLLCRVSTSWGTPDTVLEELHVSVGPNDFFIDERFVVLLRRGRSRAFLRLSPYRGKLKGHHTTAEAADLDDGACDEALESVARLVLASAWYEDQRLPFSVADTFHLPRFRSALELVGFILGSDLYRVSAGLRDNGNRVLGFFDHVYDNRPLARLLARLRRHGVKEPARLEASARDAFETLNRAFSGFLSTTGALHDLERLELYKVVLGGYGQLAEIAGRDHWSPALEQSARSIEACSVRAIRRILSTQRDSHSAAPVIGPRGSSEP